MRTVLFADDDMLVLNRLRDIVDWASLGYVVVGQAMDGSTALSMAKKLKPDLLILDINMPRMDGVAVAKEMKTHLPATHILILSNHDTFEYVRLTLRYGVNDYLLKHELTAVLLTQKLKDLESLRQQEEFEEKRHSYFAEVAKQQFLQELIINGVEASPQTELMFKQREFSAAHYQPVALWITNFPLLTAFDSAEKRDKLVSSITNLVTNVLSNVGNGIITHLGTGLFALLFTFENDTASVRAEQSNAFAALAKSNIYRLLNLDAGYCLCRPTANIKDLHRIYRDEEKAYSLLSPVQLDVADERRFIDALYALEIGRVTEMCRHIIMNDGPAAELLRLARHFFREKELAVDEAVSAMQAAFRQPLSKEEVCEKTEAFFADLIRKALLKSNADYSLNVQNAIAYIRAHFMQDISLSTIAEAVGVSPAHLSRQFGKETGESFVDYLTGYRISIAKELMKEPGMKIKDVCKKVGFRNYNYFLRVFKKHTGQTISQSNSGS
jgi:Response regulator containing CheY-like receiver domain and AraC-type DNA-binding domain